MDEIEPISTLEPIPEPEPDEPKEEPKVEPVIPTDPLGGELRVLTPAKPPEPPTASTAG